jgi:hypothetical protein
MVTLYVAAGIGFAVAISHGFLLIACACVSVGLTIILNS